MMLGPMHIGEMLGAFGIELVLVDPSVVRTAYSPVQRFGQYICNHGVGRTEIGAGAHQVDHLVDRSSVHDPAIVQHGNKVAEPHGGEGGDDTHGVGVDGDRAFSRHTRAPKAKS